MPNPRKRSRKSFVRELDGVFSLFIRSRDRRCVTCGSQSNLTCGHLFSRIAYSTRWREDNCFAQCLSCNLRHEYDPYPFMNYYLRRFGQDKLDQLHRDYSTIRKFSNPELQELIDKYKLKE